MRENQDFQNPPRLVSEIVHCAHRIETMVYINGKDEGFCRVCGKRFSEEEVKKGPHHYIVS